MFDDAYLNAAIDMAIMDAERQYSLSGGSGFNATPMTTPSMSTTLSSQLSAFSSDEEDFVQSPGTPTPVGRQRREAPNVDEYEELPGVKFDQEKQAKKYANTSKGFRFVQCGYNNKAGRKVITYKCKSHTGCGARVRCLQKDAKWVVECNGQAHSNVDNLKAPGMHYSVKKDVEDLISIGAGAKKTLCNLKSRYHRDLANGDATAAQKLSKLPTDMVINSYKAYSASNVKLDTNGGIMDWANA